MESLDNKWILQGNIQQCEQFEKTPNTLGLKNMAGVFILVAAGIVGGIGLIVIEMAYKKHQIKKQKRMELARHAADKWRGAVEVSFFTSFDFDQIYSLCHGGNFRDPHRFMHMLNAHSEDQSFIIFYHPLNL